MGPPTGGPFFFIKKKRKSDSSLVAFCGHGSPLPGVGNN